MKFVEFASLGGIFIEIFNFPRTTWAVMHSPYVSDQEISQIFNSSYPAIKDDIVVVRPLVPAEPGHPHAGPLLQLDVALGEGSGAGLRPEGDMGRHCCLSENITNTRTKDSNYIFSAGMGKSQFEIYLSGYCKKNNHFR